MASNFTEQRPGCSLKGCALGCGGCLLTLGLMAGGALGGHYLGVELAQANPTTPILSNVDIAGGAGAVAGAIALPLAVGIATSRVTVKGRLNMELTNQGKAALQRFFTRRGSAR